MVTPRGQLSLSLLSVTALADWGAPGLLWSKKGSPAPDFADEKIAPVASMAAEDTRAAHEGRFGNTVTATIDNGLPIT